MAGSGFHYTRVDFGFSSHYEEYRCSATQTNHDCTIYTHFFLSIRACPWPQMSSEEQCPIPKRCRHVKNDDVGDGELPASYPVPPTFASTRSSLSDISSQDI